MKYTFTSINPHISLLIKVIIHFISPAESQSHTDPDPSD